MLQDKDAAATLGQVADDLLAAPPDIRTVEVIAVK